MLECRASTESEGKTYDLRGNVEFIVTCLSWKYVATVPIIYIYKYTEW